MIKRAFPILALSIFSSMLGVGIITPLLPLYAENMGATGISIGMLFAGFSISRTIIMPVSGRLSDRTGRRLFLCIGLLSYAIFSLGYVYADSVSELILVRLVHGIAAGMIVPVAQAYVGDISPKGEEGKWMGYYNAAFFTGLGFGPLMGGALADHFGMNIAFFAMGGLNLLAFLIVVFFLPESGPKKLTSGPRLSFKEINASGMIKGIISFRLTLSLGRGAFIAFLPIFAGVYLGLSATLIGILVAVRILLTSLLGVYGGNIADKFNRKNLIVIGSFANLIHLALIPMAGNFEQLLGICILGGLSGAISMPAASAMAVEKGREFGMGSIMALFGMAFSVGMAVGPILSGVIADLLNISSVFYFGAIMGLVGTILFIRFTK